MNSLEDATIEAGEAKNALALQPVNLPRRVEPDANQVLQWAQAIAGSSFCPASCMWATDPQKTVYNLMRVVEQALRWGISPFAAADESYVTKGKLGYGGKLVAAVVNSRAGLVGRLNSIYDGAGPNRRVTIIGQFVGEKEPRTVTATFGQSFTANDMWAKDPDQKLYYTGVVKWARRHCPEILLGVQSVEDLEVIGGEAIEEPRPAERMPYADEQVTTQGTGHPGGKVDGQGHGQTLQEAMQAEQAEAPAPSPDAGIGKCDFIQLQRLAAELQLLYTALKIPGAPEGTEDRKKIRERLFTKYGVTNAQDLSANACESMVREIANAVLSLRSRAEGVTEKH